MTIARSTDLLNKNRLQKINNGFTRWQIVTRMSLKMQASTYCEPLIW